MAQLPSLQKSLSDSPLASSHSWWPLGEVKHQGMPQDGEQSCKVSEKKNRVWVPALLWSQGVTQARCFLFCASVSLFVKEAKY